MPEQSRPTEFGGIGDALQSLAGNLADGRALLAAARADHAAASWARVLAHLDFWSLRHDWLHTIRTMRDVELQQSVVEDLLLVAVETARGAAGTYPKCQLYRHLGAADDLLARRRIARALSAVIERGLVVPLAEDALALAADQMQAAMDFCGVYFFGDVEDPAPDVFDAMMAVGGQSLVTETFEDIAVAVGHAICEPDVQGSM